MDTIFAFGLGSLKALLLLMVASGVALTLRGRPARLRAVIWATALVGSLMIPLVSTVVPAFMVELPVELPEFTARNQAPPIQRAIEDAGSSAVVSARTLTPIPAQDRPPALSMPEPATVVVSIWAVVALLLLTHQAIGLVRMSGIIRRANPLNDSSWLDCAELVREQVGCRQKVRLVWTAELDIPAVYGVFRPVVVLPAHSRFWLSDRLEAVLQHEMVHVVRFDWPLRVVARVARAIYWFNPLVWWAVRRLDLEQEMACDEEVLSLGSRASSYACHLLGIARAVVSNPAAANAGLAMARRSHLEERIMRILNRSKHRKVGLAVILPAALLTAALVPAIAAVQPTEPGPKQASPELEAAMTEMREAERKLQPYISRIEEHQIHMEPFLEKIEAMELEIDHEELERIEAEMAPLIEQIEIEMKPILAQIEEMAVDMEPFHEQMEAVHEVMETMEFHIDDGTLDEIQDQIHEQMEEFSEQMESIHFDMEPYHEQLEALHEQLEPLQKELVQLSEEQRARIHEQIEDTQELMELEHEQMSHIHEQMEEVHREMEPITEEMERMGVRIETALVGDVAEVLRSHLGSVTSPGAPFTEAAARIIDDGNIHIHNDVLELDASRSEVREILTDLFAGERVGTQDAFDAALDAAVDGVSDLEIAFD